MLDEAIGGVVSVSLTAGNVTLSTASGSTDQARNALIFLTGTPGTTRTVTFPNVEKLTWVWNSSNATATLGAGGGTTFALTAGARGLFYTDGATNLAALSPTYDEGTFIPTLGDGTNNYTLSTASGEYTRIGNRVYGNIDCIWSSIGSAGAGTLVLGTLPFPVGGNAGFTFGRISGLDTTATLNQIVGLLTTTLSTIVFERVNDNASQTALPANGSSATGRIVGSFNYRV